MSQADRVVPPTAGDVAEAVVAVPGVTGLYGGVFGEIATYLPGGRVNGVVLSDESAEVHIIVDMTRDLHDVAISVRDVVRDLTGAPVIVIIEDVTVGSDQVGATGGAQR
ncbi:Asp23/Gls24 family envelope stress response protein [Gordonia sp. LSe1-13]|uniref:Asp23/Gls24 family envelope stress response protein n=1 Tax=Gordonia sesuvii TaxID=3116777 RepID=A0ABU7MI61_9ACTN|nr:Asp23/Gls24 family envelope stress response protein [Gordonia sp. LSe1-13]